MAIVNNICNFQNKKNVHVKKFIHDYMGQLPISIVVDP